MKQITFRFCLIFLHSFNFSIWRISISCSCCQQSLVIFNDYSGWMPVSRILFYIHIAKSKKGFKVFSSKRANNLLKRFCSLISALRVPDSPSISGKIYSPFSGCISPPGPNPTLGTLLVVFLFAFSVSGYFNAFVRLFGLNRPNNRFEKFAALLVKDMLFPLGKYSILFYVYKII